MKAPISFCTFCVAAAVASCATAGLDHPGAKLCSAGERVSVAWPDRYREATVVASHPDSGSCTVDYGRGGTARVHPRMLADANLEHAGAELCSVGTRVLVDWSGATWYAATALEGPQDSTCRVSYDRFGDEWNEWVSVRRLREAER